jgi:hypothetical protein
MGGGTDRESFIYTSSDSSLKGGYFVKSNQRLDLVAEFMNYRVQSQKIVLAVEFEYLPGKPEGFLNSQSIAFAAAPCNMSSFNVPQKQFSTSSLGWKMPTDGYIISARGHQHDG